MKKVFSLKKFIEWGIENQMLDQVVNSIKNGWPVECDGLTKEEMAGAGEVLSAAALTYLAGLLTSLVYFLRFMLYVLAIFGRRSNK